MGCCCFCYANFRFALNYLLSRYLDNERNLIAATVGTIVGNPWTFPFFFYLDYKIEFSSIILKIEKYEFKLNFLVQNFEELFFPTLLGSIPIAISVWLITYYLSKNILKKD